MRFLPIAAALLATQLGAAQAATQTYTATQAPNASFLQLQQFNPADGELEAVSLTLTGDLSGLIKGEATVSGGLITLTLKTDLSLGLPDATNSPLLTVTPQTVRQFLASAYDGARDYAGTSGVLFSGLTASATHTASFTDGTVLSLFTGEGSVALPLLRTNLSTVTGPASVRGGFIAQTTALASVTYTYQAHDVQLPLLLAPVPEPGTWALLLAGLGLVGWLAARRQA